MNNINNDRMADGWTTLRNSAVPKLLYGERPFVYPIFHILSAGAPEQLCASSPNIRHTFGRLGASLRLISHIKPRVEPRASSLRIVVPVYM